MFRPLTFNQIISAMFSLQGNEKNFFVRGPQNFFLKQMSALSAQQICASNIGKY